MNNDVSKAMKNLEYIQAKLLSSGESFNCGDMRNIIKTYHSSIG